MILRKEVYFYALLAVLILPNILLAFTDGDR